MPSRIERDTFTNVIKEQYYNRVRNLIRCFITANIFRDLGIRNIMRNIISRYNEDV